LTDVVFEKPVIVYDYPKEIKAFYMRLNDDQKTVAAMDVLVPKVYQNLSSLDIQSILLYLYNLKRHA
jgi:aspartyl/asparaginyl-tRNA synthetase